MSAKNEHPRTTGHVYSLPRRLVNLPGGQRKKAMTTSSSLSPSGSPSLAATLASKLSAVGSKPAALLVTQLSRTQQGQIQTSNWQTKSFTGVLTPFLSTLLLHHHRPANMSCGSLTGNGMLPHYNIVVSVFPQIKAQSLPALICGPWTLSGQWETSIKLAVLVHGAHHLSLHSPVVATVGLLLWPHS